ncbi:TPA: acyl-CoA/acyl-ACP dehydrogenase [Klebsiella pneumoniae]|nr:acyl-CoA/acyl-ACP dehydrogenase [Klebsiella pneumoniae]HBR1551417.1 acyl-CoA/acyl-ACP dehydrogenase [Klebsiella pneumoniae]HBR5063548.1 acyl-CoA/acyl-ACP dehydrogenase [Klebsiella pneumoniae]HCF8216442.1 acyl-CoA/acyl-ACP dehydrogenase [Klebsiella pneumoniae]HCF8261667.1 acyl-CoA/acyl-ACP dehydrogenase [Klebsiella pneumoniae]
MIHPERDDWARQLTALRQLMAEQAASLDASGEFPWRNIDHLRAGGWLSLAVPPSCGGAGASLAQLQQVIAAIAWGEPATALIVCMQFSTICGWRKTTPGTRRCASRFFTMLSNTVA